MTSFGGFMSLLHHKLTMDKPSQALEPRDFYTYLAELEQTTQVAARQCAREALIGLRGIVNRPVHWECRYFFQDNLKWLIVGCTAIAAGLHCAHSMLAGTTNTATPEPLLPLLSRADLFANHNQSIIGQYEQWLAQVFVGVDSPYREPADREVLFNYLRTRRVLIDGHGAVDTESNPFDRLFDAFEAPERHRRVRASFAPVNLMLWIVQNGDEVDVRFPLVARVVRDPVQREMIWPERVPVAVTSFWDEFHVRPDLPPTSFYHEYHDIRFADLVMRKLMVGVQRENCGSIRDKLLTRLRNFEARSGGSDADVGAFLERQVLRKYGKTLHGWSVADFFPGLARYAENVHQAEFFRELLQAYNVIGELDEPCVPRAEYQPVLNYLFRKYFPDANYVARRRERDRYLKLIREVKKVRNHTLLRLGSLAWSDALQARSLRVAFGESARSLRKEGSIASDPHLDVYIVNFCMAVTTLTDGVQVHKMH